MSTNSKMTLLILAAVLMATLLHIGYIGQTPWDWDEPVYTRVAQQTGEWGHPTLNIDGQGKWYTYHPPFHFIVLNTWDKMVGSETIEAGRWLSSLVAIATVVLAMAWVGITQQDGYKVALTGLLLATDGWFSYSSLLVKLDTTAIMVGLTGMIGFSLALFYKRQWLYIAAGTIIGMATVYKHVAAVFLVAIAVHWLLSRPRRNQEHLLVIGTALAILAVYVLGMLLFVGDPFIEATQVQVRRTLGLQEARGLDYGLTEVVEAMFQTYWAFLGTIIVLVIGTLYALWLAWQNHRGYFQEMTPIVAWMLSAVVMLGAIKLRNPHYLPYAIVPASILTSHLLVNLFHDRYYRRRWASWAVRLLVVIMFLNASSAAIRFTNFSQNNALEELTGKMMQLDHQANVVAEEPVCALVPQPCYVLGKHQTEDRLASIPGGVDYIVVYTSKTQKPPQTPAILNRLAQGEVIYTTSGWKETLTVVAVAD